MDDRAVPDTPSARYADITASEGINVGDGPQVNLFLRPPLSGPAVAGRIPQPPSAFQPREELLAQLRAAGSGASVVCAVPGMRGVGKTQLAAAYARECRAAGWRLIAWIDAEDAATVVQGMAVVARRLGIDSTDKPHEEVALEVRNRLEADGERCLIVFDNVTDPDVLAAYAPSLGAPQVIVTTTELSVVASRKSVQVDVFTPEMAQAYLAQRTKRNDPSGARTLAEELGNLPLALAQAAAVIAEDGENVTYSVYLDRLRSLPLEEYLTPSVGEHYKHGLAKSIIMSVNAVKAADATGLCEGLLDLISVLSPSGVSRELLHTAGAAGYFSASGRSGVFRRRRRHDVVAPQLIDAALARLVAGSLLTFTADGGSVISHRLVTRVVREWRIHEGTAADIGARAIKALEAVPSSVGDGPWMNPFALSEFASHLQALTAHLMPLVKWDSGLPSAVLRLTERAVEDALVTMTVMHDVLTAQHEEPELPDADTSPGEGKAPMDALIAGLGAAIPLTESGLGHLRQALAADKRSRNWLVRVTKPRRRRRPTGTV